MDWQTAVTGIVAIVVVAALRIYVDRPAYRRPVRSDQTMRRETQEKREQEES